MANSGLGWMIASRYLVRDKNLSLRLHYVTLIFFLAVVGLGSAQFAGLAFARRHVGMLEWWLGVDFILGIATKVCAVIAMEVALFVELNRRFNIFAAISIFGAHIGTSAMVVALSVMSGFETDLQQKILGTHAHVTVENAHGPFSDYQPAVEQLARLPDVIGVTPMITNEVMITSKTNLSGVVLQGIDPATIGKVTDFTRNLELGSIDYLNDAEKLRQLREAPRFGHDEETPKEKEEPRRLLPGVVIGRELAKSLRVYLGDDVNIVSPLGGIGPSGPIPKSKPFRIAGIFFSGYFEYDTKYIYVTIPAAQKFLDMPDEITDIELKLGHPARSDEVVATASAMLGPKYEVRDWKMLNRSLFSALKLEKILMFLVLSFIVLVAAFCITAICVMLVTQRQKEIAILKTMGSVDGAIVLVFVLLGVSMSSLGTIFGVAFGLFYCFFISQYDPSGGVGQEVFYFTKLPVHINPIEISTVVLAALVIGVCATIYPAWKAAQLRPVEGLRDAAQ